MQRKDQVGSTDEELVVDDRSDPPLGRYERAARVGTAVLMVLLFAGAVALTVIAQR